MESIKSYLTIDGWKADLEKTLTDVKDIGILARRVLGISDYGLPKFGGEMNSKETKRFVWDSTALWFNNEQKFQNYATTNYWPLGRCLIWNGKNARRYDDSALFS